MLNSKAKKTGHIFLIAVMLIGIVLYAMPLQVVRAVENESTKAIVQYDFNGNFTDSLGESTLTSFRSIDDGKGHKNSSSSFGTDGVGGDATYWQWTSDSRNGGGFYIDLNKDISEEYSIGVRFSYNLINPSYTKIIDFKNMTSDTGFYFYGGKLKYYPYNNIGSKQIAKDQIVDLIATRSKTDKKFIAYIVVNGVLQKEFEVTDNSGYAIPATPNGKPRLGFFFDDYNGEATTGGKVYSLKVWDKPITALDAEKAMDRIPTVIGVTPTTTANNDGKIIKTTTEMEYKKSTDTEWKTVSGTEITGLSTGTYNVRYANPVGTAVDVFVPPIINIELSENPSNYTFAGGTYNYNRVTVANSVSSITVTPTGMVGSIKVNGSSISSGETSNPISLPEGIEVPITVESTVNGSPTIYTINVTRAKNSTISPTVGSFDKKTSAQADVSTTMTLSGNTLSTIKNGDTVLIEDTDYTTSGSAITIKKEYLVKKPVGTTNLTFTFSAGDTQTLAITVNDTTPPKVFAVAPPTSVDNGVNDDGKSSVTVTWADSATATVDHYEIVAKVGSAPAVSDTVTGKTNIGKLSGTATFDWNEGNNLYVGVVAVDANGLKTLCSGTTTANVTVAADGHTVIVPSMNVKGNGKSIASGDTTPSTEDDTDFGSVNISEEHYYSCKKFTIENIGTGSLALSVNPKVQISGADKGDFEVYEQPTSPVAAGENTTFIVVFNPSTAGTKSATISIANDDSSKNPYTFDIKGIGIVSNDATLSYLRVNEGIFNEDFESQTITYTITVEKTVDKIKVTPTVKESHATVTVNGTSVSNDQQSNDIPLSIGENTISVVVKAQDGTSTKTYTIKVTRCASGLCGDVNGDGKVDLNDALEIKYYVANMNSNMSQNALVNINIPQVSDINADGRVDLDDALEIMYYKVHMNSSMSSQGADRINKRIWFSLPG